VNWQGDDPSVWAFPPAHTIETKRALRRLECEETAWGATSVTLSELVTPGDCFARWDGKDGWKVDNWLAEGALRRKSVALLAGEAGTGKTYAAWDLMISVLRGEKWLGHFECECGPVYYQGGEGQEDMLRRRHLGLCVGRGIDIAEFNANELRWLTFYVPKRRADGYPTVPAHPLSTPTFRERLLRAVRSRPLHARPALFVFDPLITMVANVDNDSEGASHVMNWALELAEESNACVLLVHHLNKSEDRSHRGRIRGESTWVNLAQTVYVMEAAKSDADLTLFYDNKQRDDEADKHRARWAVRRSFEPVLEPSGFLAGAEPGVIKATQLLYMPGSEAEALEKAHEEAQAELKRSAKKNGADNAVALSLEPTLGGGAPSFSESFPNGAVGPLGSAHSRLEPAGGSVPPGGYPPTGVVVRDGREALSAQIEAIERFVLTAQKPVTRYAAYTALKDQGLGKGHPVVKQILDWLVADGRVDQQEIGAKTYFLAPGSAPSSAPEPTAE
jgi:hypothetical protein